MIFFVKSQSKTFRNVFSFIYNNYSVLFWIQVYYFCDTCGIGNNCQKARTKLIIIGISMRLKSKFPQNSSLAFDKIVAATKKL